MIAVGLYSRVYSGFYVLTSTFDSCGPRVYVGFYVLTSQ